MSITKIKISNISSVTGTGSVVLSASPTFTGTVSGITASMIGLGNVTNNADVANLSGTNTGDETSVTIKAALSITTLSGSNTGDQTSVSGNAGGLSTTLVVASGGTGLTTVGTSGNVLTSNGTAWVSSPAPISLPTQTGNTGKYLTTDGTIASWITVPKNVSVLSRSGVNILIVLVSNSLSILTRSSTTIQVGIS